LGSYELIGNKFSWKKDGEKLLVALGEVLLTIDESGGPRTLEADLLFRSD